MSKPLLGSHDDDGFQALFENNRAAMLLIDPASSRLVDANPAACKYYGWSREAFQRLHLADLSVLGADALAVNVRLALGPHDGPFRVQHRLADGSVRDAEIACGPVSFGTRTLLSWIPPPTR